MKISILMSKNDNYFILTKSEIINISLICTCYSITKD